MNTITRSVVVCLVLCGMSISVCRGADVTFINKTGKKVYFAIAYHTKGGSGWGKVSGNASGLAYIYNSATHIKGWFEMQPNASRTFNKGAHEFYYCMTYNGVESTIPNSKPHYFWVHPTDAFESEREHRQGVLEIVPIISDGTDMRDQEALKPSRISWGKRKQTNGYDNKKYFGGTDPKCSSSDLKKLGWRAFLFYQTPDKAERITFK